MMKTKKRMRLEEPILMTMTMAMAKKMKGKKKAVEVGESGRERE